VQGIYALAIGIESVHKMHVERLLDVQGGCGDFGHKSGAISINPSRLRVYKTYNVQGM
jgi:hypothetical protein